MNIGRFFKPLLYNAAQGIIPTVSGWDTPPSDLYKATDGDPDTTTGTGSTERSSAGTFGYIDLNLNIKGIYLVGLKVGIWSTTNSISVYLYSKSDGINYEKATEYPIVYHSSNNEHVHNGDGVIINGQHVRIRFYISGAATGYVNIYEIWAYKLG